MQEIEEGSASQRIYACAVRNKIRIAKIQDKFKLLKEITGKFAVISATRRKKITETGLLFCARLM